MAVEGLLMNKLNVDLLETCFMFVLGISPSRRRVYASQGPKAMSHKEREHRRIPKYYSLKGDEQA